MSTADIQREFSPQILITTKSSFRNQRILPSIGGKWNQPSEKLVVQFLPLTFTMCTMCERERKAQREMELL